MDYDFVAIGDIVTDAFIRLKEASVHCSVDKENCEICMRFADKIPYEDVYVVPAVGNSANAAVAASRLGLKTGLVANIGDDFQGKECISALTRNGVSTEFVKTHIGIKTNYHYVLWYEDDRTILIKHEAYDYALPEINSPKWIYLSSLGGNGATFHKTIEQYLDVHPDVKLAFQPGTFQIKMGHEALKKIYNRTEVFFCNKEEAQRILKTDEHDIKTLLQKIHALGPKVVSITDGPDGAYARDYDGKVWRTVKYPDPKPPYERTGAGDAFSATFAVALAHGLPVSEALRWGPINSMSVVQYVGAQEGLLTRAQIEEYLKSAPDYYVPKQI
ncbi:MAG: carbohydrate kinase family protein [Patescibacteria group bacterium]